MTVVSKLIISPNVKYKITDFPHKTINKRITHIFGICTLSASFCLPKSCQGRDLVVAGLLFIEELGLFGTRGMPVTGTGSVPSNPIG